MVAVRIRRWGAWVLALALVVGPAAHASLTTGMSIAMASAADMPMPMSGDCDRCGPEADGMAGSLCMAQCTLPGAILPASLALQKAALFLPSDSLQRAADDRHRPPDPHPPRTILLG